MVGLVFRVDRIDVRRVRRERQSCALPASCGDNGFEDRVNAINPFESLDRIERVKPFLCFGHVDFNVLGHKASLLEIPYFAQTSRLRSNVSRGCNLGNCLTVGSVMRNSHGKAQISRIT